MDIIVDTREQQPLAFTQYKKTVKKVIRKTLKTGDYAPLGYQNEIVIERKNPMDLFNTLGKGHKRFKKELLRAQNLKFFGLLIEYPYDEIYKETFPESFRTKMRGHVVIKQLHTIQIKYNVHLYFARNRGEASRIVVQTFAAYIRLKRKEEKLIEKVMKNGKTKR